MVRGGSTGRVYLHYKQYVMRLYGSWWVRAIADSLSANGQLLDSVSQAYFKEAPAKGRWFGQKNISSA